MKEKVISERVVSRKVVGKANPIARKFRNLKGSFGGVCIAPVIVIIALGLLYYGEKFQKQSKVVEELKLEDASEVKADSGMHKMRGKPTVVEAVEVLEIGEVLYYSYQRQQYQEVEETEHETVEYVEDGEDVEEEIERTKLVEKWVDMESKSEWSEFKLGEYNVNTSGADLKFNLAEKEYREENDEYFELSSSQSITPEVGDYRITVSYLPIDTQLLIVGEISSNTIKKGEMLIISDKTDSDLISSLKSSETALYWTIKGVAWILLTIGFLMILNPILSLADFIPIAGKAVSCVASIAAGIISLGIIVAITFIIKFWWVLLILTGVGVVVLIVILVMLMKKHKDKKEDKVEEKE